MSAYDSMVRNGSRLLTVLMISLLRTGLSATRSKSLPLPIVGLNYTHNPSGIAERFEISADASGMSAGSYGHYARGSTRVGARVL